MSDKEETIYWWDDEGVLHNFTGRFEAVMHKCLEHNRPKYYCYGTGYQFGCPWYVLDAHYNILANLELAEVPAYILTTHLILHGT